MSVKSDEVMVCTKESKISEPTLIGSILYDNDTTRNSVRVQELKGRQPADLSDDELWFMAPFVCPAKTEYDLRKNPYIVELSRRAGTLDLLMSEHPMKQKRAFDEAKKLGSGKPKKKGR